MSGVCNGRVVKLWRRRHRCVSAVGLKRMAKEMQEGNGTGRVVPQEFLETGRTGRRNALPDILVPQPSASTAEVTTRLQQLSTHDPENPQPGPSTSRAGAEETKPDPGKKDGS